MSEIYHVAFHMPEWIRAGLDSKVYEAIGGVIRHVEDKTIVAWLRPATNAVGDMVEVVPNLSLLPGGTTLAVPTFAVASAAAAVIVVVAVGFKMVLNKLEIIDRRLDDLMVQLRDVKKDITWLKQSEWIKQRASVKAALLGCADAERDQRYDDLRYHITTFREVQHFLLEHMSSMVSEDAPLTSSAAFVDVARMLVLVSQAKGRAITLATNSDIATAELNRDANAYYEIRNNFLLCLDQPEDHIDDLIMLTPAHWDEAKIALSTLPRVDQLQYCHVSGIELNRRNLLELRTLLEPGPNQPCALLISKAAAPIDWTPRSA